MYLAIVTVVIAGLSDLPSAAFVNLFDSGSVECEIGGSFSKIPYRLFVPRNQSEGERLPLIIWLHGAGSKGSDNVQQLYWLDQLILRYPSRAEQYRFFLLAVQVPESETSWCRENYINDDISESMPLDMLHAVSNLVDEITQVHKIDTNKIVATGVSMGAYACWELVIRYPKRFAGIAPISLAGGAMASMSRLESTPVWAFNCSRDRSSPLNPIKARVSAINAVGGIAKLTIIDSDSHDAWTKAFLDHNLLEWLLLQDRSISNYQIGIPFGIRSKVTKLIEHLSVDIILAVIFSMMVMCAVTRVCVVAICYFVELSSSLKSKKKGTPASWTKRGAVFWFFAVLGVSALLLLLQLNPVLVDTILYCIDSRNWLWSVIIGGNVVIIVAVMSLRDISMRQ